MEWSCTVRTPEHPPVWVMRVSYSKGIGWHWELLHTSGKGDWANFESYDQVIDEIGQCIHGFFFKREPWTGLRYKDILHMDRGILRARLMRVTAVVGTSSQLWEWADRESLAIMRLVRLATLQEAQ